MAPEPPAFPCHATADKVGSRDSSAGMSCVAPRISSSGIGVVARLSAHFTWSDSVRRAPLYTKPMASMRVFYTPASEVGRLRAKTSQDWLWGEVRGPTLRGLPSVPKPKHIRSVTINRAPLDIPHSSAPNTPRP